jgi:phage tail-like protein
VARGLIEELGSPWPISVLLPGMLRDDEFASRFASAFDTLVAPVHTTLDCIDSYFDPWLTPPDFLKWLATWVAVELDELLPIERQRLLVSEAVRLYRVRGTAIGLAEHVAIYTEPRLLVRVIASSPEDVDLGRVEALVASAKPAHLPHRIEIVNEDTGKVIASEGPAEPAPAPAAAAAETVAEDVTVVEPPVASAAADPHGTAGAEGAAGSEDPPPDTEQ